MTLMQNTDAKAITEQASPQVKEAPKQVTAHVEQVTPHAEEAHGHVIGDATFWVALATLSFVLLLVWKKIPGMITKTLDDRSNAIKDQLDNARHLREEASALLAKYQRDQHEAEKNAEEMIAHAEAEAKLLADEAKADMVVMIERRTKIAAEKIKQAEVNAIKEIRAVTVEVATATARDLIASNLKKAGKDALIKESIDTLDKRFH